MSILDGGSIDNPKPQRPISSGSQKISLHVQNGEDKLSATEFNRKLNFAMEVMKFFPDWENQVYAGEKNEEKIASAKNQYGEQITDDTGEAQMTFGQVLRSTSYGQLKGANLGGYTDEIDFYDTAGDYDHIKDGLDNDADTPVEELIDESLWSKVKDALSGEERNYYEMVMDGIDDLNPEKAYYLMVSMLESRTRIVSTMNDMFGSPDISDEERKTKFNEFIQNYSGKIETKKLGMLEFLLNTQQSFFSRVFPLFGGTSDFYESDLDKEKAEEFYTTLSAKVAEYIGVTDMSSVTDADIQQMTDNKKNAVLLLDKWLNPTGFIGEDQNVDPTSTEWGAAAVEKTSDYIDQLTQENVINRILTRRNNLQYKQKMQEWEDKKEEQTQEEILEVKQQAKNRELSKSIQRKMQSASQAKSSQQRQVNKLNINNKTKAGSSGKNASFNKAVASLASKVRAVQGKTTSVVRSSATPSRTTAAKTSSISSNAVLAGAATGNRVARTLRKASKAGDAVKAVKPATNKSSATLRAASSSKATRLSSTTAAARTAMTKAYTKANIKSKAPKQAKE